VQPAVIIEPIGPAAYESEVLPASFSLWAYGRSFDRYAGDFRAFVASPYGKRRFATVGLRDGGRVAASCKAYAREIRWNEAILRATGIGAVFTPKALRGRGFASAMIGALLDRERDAGRDVAFLYSDIHPAFYERLGFHALPSRTIFLRATSLDGSHAGGVPLEAAQWPAIRRCFEALDAKRLWSFRRTPLVWDWVRRQWNRPLHDAAQAVHLVVRRGRSVAAYVVGRRLPREDTFVLDEFACDGEAGQGALPALVRAAAGDLRRVAGWLPPPVARDVLPRGSVRARKEAILMVVPLSRLGRAWWADVRGATLECGADASWNADHI